MNPEDRLLAQQDATPDIEDLYAELDEMRQLIVKKADEFERRSHELASINLGVAMDYGLAARDLRAIADGRHTANRPEKAAPVGMGLDRDPGAPGLSMRWIDEALNSGDGTNRP